jgi:hypothetical protein
MSGKGKNTTVKNPAWMLRKAVPQPGSGLGFNTSMNKTPKRNLSPARTTRKVGSTPSPKRPKKKRGTRRRAGGTRIMYE